MGEGGKHGEEWMRKGISRERRMAEGDMTESDRGNMTDGDRTEDETTELTLEGRLARLEEILARMESEEIELEEALKLFEEGVGHVREAERVLSETELRVEELLADGSSRAVDADGDA